MSETPGELDPERVRELAAYWEQMIDTGKREMDEAGREYMRSFTPAEVGATIGLLLAKSVAEEETHIAINADPDGPEAQLSRMVHAGEPDPSAEFDGLPEDAMLVFVLRIKAWRSAECAAAALERMAAWTSADRLAFEERFASRLPSGGHWPG